MRQWLRSHLTYANVMVTILAFIVLGGGIATAGGGPFVRGTEFSDVQQVASTNGPVQTNSRHFKRIPGAAATLSSTPSSRSWLESATTVTLMVVVKSGKGVLRVIDGEGGSPPPYDGSPMYPHSVRIAGKGEHTVIFILNPGQQLIWPPEPQWKRTGDKPLKAKTVVTSIQGHID
jgi:hypothetical protein